MAALAQDADAMALAEVHVASGQGADASPLPVAYRALLLVCERAGMCARIWARMWAPACERGSPEIPALHVLAACWGREVGRLLGEGANAGLQAGGFACVMPRLLCEHRRVGGFYARLGMAAEPDSRQTFRRAGVELSMLAHRTTLPVPQ